MKITLQVNGREMTFTEQELTAIVEKLLLVESVEKEAGISEMEFKEQYKWFEVDPAAISRDPFRKTRQDAKQEELRKKILKALDEVETTPEKYMYGKAFKTLLPPKKWEESIPISELVSLSYRLGGYMATEVEQTLEWAQRIVNGEPWENICNYADTADYYRIIREKNSSSKYRIVGGSVKCNDANSAFTISNISYPILQQVRNVIPLIVMYC